MDKNYFLTENAYQDITSRLNTLELLLRMTQNDDSLFVDNQQFIQLLHISKRLAQTWRDSGIIEFIMVGNKIYYYIKDIKALLAKNYHPIQKSL